MSNIDINKVVDLLSYMSKHLCLSLKDVYNVALTAPYRYKTYKIPKKRPGEFRTISQPAKEVKLLQRFVVTNLLPELPMHNTATAYSKGSSIKLNALKHVENSYLLKMDFSNFFPSIVPDDFFSHLKKYLPGKFNDEELFILSRILFWRNKETNSLQLSIGSPGSPYLSNSIMYNFDTIISAFCNDLGVVYTRYADDLSFSTNKNNTLIIIVKRVNTLVDEINYPKLIINTDKTIFCSKKYNRRVTGIVLSNDNTISLGREKKRIISSKIHHYINNKLAEQEIASLKGILAFAKDVEPEFLERLAIKYGDSILHKLIK